MVIGFPIIFWSHSKTFKVFYIPHNVNKVRARKALQGMIDRAAKAAVFNIGFKDE